MTTRQSATPLHNPLLLIMVLAAFVSVLNTSMVNVAIPLISQNLSVAASSAGWIITAYSLVFATGVALYGRIADSYSLRGTFLLGLVVFAAGSLICAAAPQFGVLVAGRAIQAAGAAAIPALAFGSVPRLFKPDQRGMAFGLLSASVGVGAAAGPILGGIGVSLGGWRALFLATGVLLRALFLTAWRWLPHETVTSSPPPTLASLDLPGGTLLAMTAALALFGITGIHHGGGISMREILPFVLAVAAGLCFAWRICAVATPFAPPALFTNRTFLAASAVALLSQFAYLGGGLFVAPLLLVGVSGLSSFGAGLVLAPSAIAVAVLSPVAGRASDRLGPKAVLAVCLSTLLAGLLFLSCYGAGASPYVIAGGLLIMGVGYAGITAPAANAVSRALSEENAGVGFGIYQLFFFLGAGAGAAVLGAFLAARRAQPAGALNPFYRLSNAAAPFSDTFLMAGVAVARALVALLAIRNRPINRN